MKPLLSVLLATVLSNGCRTAADNTIGLAQPIQHDDFFYSAQRVVVQDSIGPLKTKGHFWIVTFRVDNKAVRVTHSWTNDIPFVTDERGISYENRIDAQKALNARQPFGRRAQYTTPAGQTDSTRFVFELPASVLKPYLHFRGEVLMGDVFDGRQFEHTAVRLF